MTTLHRAMADAWGREIDKRDALDRAGKCSVRVIRRRGERDVDHESSYGYFLEHVYKEEPVCCGKPARRFLDGHQPICRKHYDSKRAELERELPRYREASEQHDGKTSGERLAEAFGVARGKRA